MRLFLAKKVPSIPRICSKDMSAAFSDQNVTKLVQFWHFYQTNENDPNL